jgi:undecaprenyl-diphosphatase
MEYLINIDKALFLFLNKSFTNPVFDSAMPFITEVDHWKILFVLIWLSLIIFGGRKGRIVALLVIIIVTVSDQISSSVIKPWIGRSRPCFSPWFVLEGARLLIQQTNSYSFPSSHAANMTAMAILFSVKYSRFKWLFIFIAIVVSYSRVYVGVHYPLDLLGGAIVGFLSAFLILILEKRIVSFWYKRKAAHKDQEPTAVENDS